MKYRDPIECAIVFNSVHEAQIRQKAIGRMYETSYGPKEIGEYFKMSEVTLTCAGKKSRLN